MTRTVGLLIAFVVSLETLAQNEGGMVMMKPSEGTVCYATTHNAHTSIGPPPEYIRALKARNSGAARTTATNIIVTYSSSFTSQAQAAFQEAVDIWASIIQSPVTIRIHAQWTPLNQNVLGSASPGTYVTNFPGAQKRDVWYPIALAEKIAGKDLNATTDADIVASFNSNNSNWHYGLTGSEPPTGKYDLVSIVLHEIGHGLGITNAYSVESDQGLIPDFFEGQPVVFETSIATANGLNIVNDFTPPSATLGTAMTSENLFYVSPLVKAANGNQDAEIYAPEEFDPGSSIAHLDETKYPEGNVNSLMTPAIAAAERILDPGPIIRAILKDIGWTGSYPHHAPLESTESVSGPYHAVVTIVSDNGYVASSVVLNYKTANAFIPVTMTANGNANEFAADIPVGSSKYEYYISVKDNDNRVFTVPGKEIKPGSAPQQTVITFTAGPDTQAPFINHKPVEFTTETDGLKLEAIVSDNLGVAEVKVQWKVRGIAQADRLMTLKAGTDSTYVLDIGLNGGVNTGDVVEYRIRAKDSSVAGNVSADPSLTTFHVVEILGLGTTQNSYFNNFDDLSTEDFFGNGFTIAKPSGFQNGAIHSDHPYANGGAEGTSLNFIYNLKTPIKIAAINAIMKFDEIVLVEPGEPNVAWPQPDFYDYVVVEGSTDGGEHWTAVADGYDSRFNSEWRTTWNGSLSNNNSTAVGTPAMYKTHQFDLLNKFKVGDEVAFRFRLYSDPFSVGWGWSIDNLQIQIDTSPPQILHQHNDFLLAGVNAVDLNFKVTDPSGVSKIVLEYNKTGGTTTSRTVAVNSVTNQYVQTIDLAALGVQAGDKFQYRIEATDIAGNTSSYPPTGFIETAIISLASSVDQVVTDFTSASEDLTGNFFSTDRPAGFTSNGMSSVHPYSPGIDIDQVSEFAWLTRKPVKVSATNALIVFEDVAIVEYEGTSVKDYVIVEASKDGVAWEPLLGPYAANSVTQWKTIFDGASNGTQGVMQKHMFNITSSGKFKAGDVILIRFRLHSDAATTGWGWFVDNLSIQGPITGIEPATVTPNVTAWPNPVTAGSVNLSLELPGESDVSVEILSTQGQLLSSDHFSAPSGDVNRTYDAASWPAGFYIVRVHSDYGTVTQKIIKLNSQN
ncbi:MAG TPA: T9SS type A sorting domain-containing protein [Cyclobacteriaceae bacterium]|nr:T9SS type A sorting domain-containing protein [Cyclobacteriaceae bacterium]